MRAKIFIFLFLGIVIGGGTVYFFGPKTKILETKNQQTDLQLYSCGMHPEVVSEEPGDCPICGMKLTPLREPGLSTPIEKDKESRKILYWRAPMDPTEIYDKPGKSKMGMDLVPVYEGEEAGGAGSILIDGTVQQNMNLRLSPVIRRDIERTIRAFGEVTYAQDNQYSVNTKVSGWIEKLYVDNEGKAVKKGDPLLEIYSPELVSTQEEYLIALNNFKQAESSPYPSIRRNAAKMVDLARKRLEYWDIPDTEIEKLKKKEKVLRTLVLKSPVNGIVAHKTVVEGDRVEPGMNLFHIADLSRVWVEAIVYESEITLIKPGQRAELEIDQLKKRNIAGKVDFIYPYLDGKSRANKIRLIFSNPEMQLKPGMFATVYIQSPVAKSSLAVPAEAVIYSGKRRIVFVSKGEGKFEPREVKIGIESEDGFVQVLSGLFQGEEVVVSGQFLLDSESRMREAIAKMRSLKTKEQQAEKKGNQGNKRREE